MNDQTPIQLNPADKLQIIADATHWLHAAIAEGVSAHGLPQMLYIISIFAETPNQHNN